MGLRRRSTDDRTGARLVSSFLTAALALVVLVSPSSVHHGNAFLSGHSRGSPASFGERLSTSPYGVIPLSTEGPGGEPSIGVNRYGTLLVGWMNWSGPLSGAPPGINAVADSIDHGMNFSAPRSLPTMIQKYESDVSVVSGADNGTFSIGYQSQPTTCSPDSSGVTVTQAWNNGSTLSSPFLSMSCAPFQYHDREWLGTTPNGTIFQVADVPDGLDAPDLLLARSFDGIHFGPTQILTNNSYLAVGTAAYNDTLWAIGDTTYPAKQCEVLLSSDGGLTWNPTTAKLPSACSSALDPAAEISGVEW
jgi:hypothetical protein